mgnify:FL=1
MVNRKETNLDGVKAMARTLLYTDINKTAYSPNSANFGVSQARKRVFLICYLGEECPGEILSFTDANPKTIVQKLGGRQGDRVYDQDGLSCTLTSNGGGFAGNTGLYSVGQLPIKSLTKSGYRRARIYLRAVFLRIIRPSDTRQTRKYSNKEPI